MKGGVGAGVLLAVVLAGRPALGQTPLVVGSVRDQHGAAVAGARVVARTPDGSGPAATTDSSGTFALHGTGIVSIEVSCRYCRESQVAVSPGEPVIVIVRRYDALASEAPSPSDLSNLPYAHVESSVALRPFTLLSQSTAAYPGSILSDRGLSSSGSLLVDNGAPNYDVVSGQSPYTFVPAYYEQSATLRDATNAYAYGNQAAGGIATLEPFVAGSSAEAATIGNEAIARAEVGSDNSALAFGTFSNDEESRQRGDLTANFPLEAEQSFSIAGGSEQDRDYGSATSSFAGSYSFADAAFNDPRALNLSLSTVMDRGNYVSTTLQWPTSTAWSDTGFDASVHTNGPIVAFADAGVRSSSGFYDAQSLGLERVGATLDQTRADAGVAASGNDFSVTAGVGAFWFDYAGGTYGVSQPARTSLAVPSLDAKLFPNGKWSLNLQASGSFTLPTFAEQYLYAEAQPMPVELTRNALQAAILSYTDGARVRVEFEGATENVSGSAGGRVSSMGLSAIWQVAPAISLRTWTMHVTDTAPIYGGLFPPTPAPTVNAIWLTYDTGGAIRADVLYRRDLLDELPFYHFDGAISGPIGDRLRWYAGAEDRMHRTFVDAGVRFSAR
ncbi:MAG TPA: hypothetical protein VHT92_02715 [Candidatus Cybelea sp.]|nr:hypothetical protein [Candidatus Cybelea sp.]